MFVRLFSLFGCFEIVMPLTYTFMEPTGAHWVMFSCSCFFTIYEVDNKCEALYSNANCVQYVFSIHVATSIMLSFVFLSINMQIFITGPNEILLANCFEVVRNNILIHQMLYLEKEKNSALWPVDLLNSLQCASGA